METEIAPEHRPRGLQEADDFVRANPVPAVLGALAIGFTLGLVARALERRRRPTMEERYLEAKGLMRGFLEPVGKTSREAIRASRQSARDAWKSARRQARKVDIEDYTGPIRGWWNRVVDRCCD